MWYLGIFFYIYIYVYNYKFIVLFLETFVFYCRVRFFCSVGDFFDELIFIRYLLGR